MNEERIIKFYREGFSIDYIAKVYYKYKNKNKKPVVINGITLFPVKIFNMKDCRLYVVEVIYKFIINDWNKPTHIA